MAQLSQAEKWRRHRAEMALVMAGKAATPKEAREQLDRMQAWERLRATRAMIEARRSAPPAASPIADRPGPKPWMMAD